MQNKLKPATIPTLQVLNKADIRAIMATGDNMLTALSVGRKAQIINNEETVFLGDLVEYQGQQSIYWKISTQHDEIVDNNAKDD